jgi:hypothetical protein
MQNGTSHSQSPRLPNDSRMGRHLNPDDGGGDMGSTQGRKGPETAQQRLAGFEGRGCEGINGEDANDYRDHPKRYARVHGRSQGSEGLILGKLYRLIFGGIKGDVSKDLVVIAAYARVSRALEGLDQDVLTLMQATLRSDVGTND